MTNSSPKKSFIVRWKISQIILLGSALIFFSIISIIFIDQTLTQKCHLFIKGQLDSVARFVTWFGLGDLYFYIAVFGYLLTRLFSTRLTHLSWTKRLAEFKHHFSFMFLCFSISGLMVAVMKSIIGRSRPYNSNDFIAQDFHPLTLNWDWQSYPSGHTQVGFTLAAFVSVLFPRLTPYAMIFATLVGLSRVLLEKHFLGDVVAGAFVGILGTYIAWHWKGKIWLLKR